MPQRGRGAGVDHQIDGQIFGVAVLAHIGGDRRKPGLPAEGREGQAGVSQRGVRIEVFERHHQVEVHADDALSGLLSRQDAVERILLMTQDLPGVFGQRAHEAGQVVVGGVESQGQGVGKQADGLFVESILAVVQRHADEHIGLSGHARDVRCQE